MPPTPSNDICPRWREGRAQGQRFGGPGVLKLQLDSSQQQMMTAESIAEEAVVSSIAKTGIANDWMKNVFHVPAQLVASPGPWIKFRQRITTGGIASYCTR